MARVVILGAKGQLGTDLCQEYEAAGEQDVPLGHSDLDIRDYGQGAEPLASLRPYVVINTAASTNIETCERSFEM